MPRMWPTRIVCFCRSVRLLWSSNSCRSTSTRSARVTSRMCLRLPRQCANCPSERTAVPQAKRCSFSSSAPLRCAHAPSTVGSNALLVCAPLLFLYTHSLPVTQVTPDHPDDLHIIVDDLRAFMSSSNVPASITEMFPQTIETLLIDYIKALGPQHAVVRCRLPCPLSCTMLLH